LKQISKVKLSPAEANLPVRTRIPRHSALEWVPKNANCEELPRSQVSVFVTQNAYIRMCAHAGSDLFNEVGGWMAGKYCQDQLSDELFIVVDTVLPALYTDQGAAHLTFTGDTQVALYDRLEKDHPGKTLVGWYHTHPRMGVFFSQWDAWLHQNFFPHAWQVALVIEPHSSFGGFFIRQADGELDQRNYYVFNELITNKQRSVVFWKNLQLAEEACD